MREAVRIEANDEGVKISLQHREWREQFGEQYFEQLAMIVKSIHAANEAMQGLDDHTFDARRAGFAAQDLRLQMAMEQVVSNSELLVAVAEGRETMADYGFSEFDNE